MVAGGGYGITHRRAAAAAAAATPAATVGGHIRNMAWDSTSTRLAVSFAGSRSGSELIAVFDTSQLEQTFHLVRKSIRLVGLLRGPPPPPTNEDLARDGGIARVTASLTPMPAKTPLPNRGTSRKSVPAASGGAESPFDKDDKDKSPKLNKAVRLAFAPHFLKGALLTVVWQGGLITSHPMYFSSSDNDDELHRARKSRPSSSQKQVRRLM
mmetsp:Transcript_11629/g.22125  ORF Transcript_11629/g.22125 Transcript_11629/m.22125 type:complete len:211 (-) Transcript_11629:176-808(-)